MRVFCAGRGGRLAFEHPEDGIEAWHAGDVAGAFARIEAAQRAGKYVAGFVSYELGASLVPRQTPPADGDLPLISLGIFASAGVEPELPRDSVSTGPLVPRVSRTRYRDDLATIAAAIREGDVYQVNYAVPFDFAYAGDPLSLYAALTRDGAYPYAAFVERDAYALVSCSPELFVRAARGTITTKPMKGTARLERAHELDERKNRAEHVMIVDLLRNDLHRLSRNVAVERLLEVERYPAYATMTSTISAAVDPELSFEAILRAMFPCGSVTGAPKISAMRSIARTERRARGIFCGSIGYLAPDRSGVWNVAIRTATLDRHAGRGRLEVGGGIVADSTPEIEWAEIETKRSFFARVAPEYALIETMLRGRDGTIASLEPHLRRLRASCDDLHFAFDEAAIRTGLREYAAPGPTILRLVLERDGRFAISSREFEEPSEPVNVCWAEERVDSAEPLQRHKTTSREHYDAALARARSNACFDALLLNERGELADGARTTVFIGRGDHLVTPPLAGGALPGILRARLLATGAAREAVLVRGDVTSASDVYIGSSVRGLLRANVLDAG